MNWYKIIGFVLLLLGIGLYAQEKENDWEKEKLKGKVKSVSEVKYTTKGSNIEGKSKKIEYYNLKGYRTEEYWINIKYGNSEKTTYIYDTKNNVIEQNYYNSERKLDEKTTYSYDEKGNKIQETMYKGGVINYISIYNDTGKEVELKNYNEEGQLTDICISIYDEKGDFVEGKQYDANGKFIGDFKRFSLDTGVGLTSWLPSSYKYDEMGNWIERIVYCKKKKPCYTTKREIEYYK